MSWIVEIAVSSDGTLIAVGDNGGHIVVYDVRSSQIILRIHDHKDCIAGLAFDCGRNCLITASGGNPPRDNSIRVYAIPEGKLIWHYQHNEAFNQIAYCSANNSLFTLDWRGGIDLWDVEKRLHVKNLQLQIEEERRHIDQIDSISFSADFRQILKVWESGQSFKLQVFGFPDFRVIWERSNFPQYFSPPESSLPAHVVPPGWDHAYTLSHNAHFVAFSVDACLILWDVLNDQELWHSDEHFYWIENIVFSKDDKFIVTGARDATIKIWDVESGVSIKTISTCRSYTGLRLTEASGLDSNSLRGLRERGAII